MLFCTDSALWHAGILQWTPAKGSQAVPKTNKGENLQILMLAKRTPERFWDPDIIEDSAEDPRNKIIHDASPLRKRREEKAFEVGEVVNGDEFE